MSDLKRLGGCPCEHTTPCSDMCSCAHPFMSAGCQRCCSYGNPTQQLAAAEHLAKIIDTAKVDAPKTLAPESPTPWAMTNSDRTAKVVVDLADTCNELRNKVRVLEELANEREAFAAAAKTLYSVVYQCCGRDSVDELSADVVKALDTIRNLSFPEIVPSGCHFESTNMGHRSEVPAENN